MTSEDGNHWLTSKDMVELLSTFCEHDVRIDVGTDKPWLPTKDIKYHAVYDLILIEVDFKSAEYNKGFRR